MKKLIALFLALAMIFAFAACGSNDAPASTPADKPADSAPADKPADKPADEPAEPTSTDTYTFSYATVDAEGSDHDIRVEQVLKQLLEEKSGGRMTLDVYYSSGLTGVGSTLDGIKNGTVDMGFDACGFYVGEFLYTELFSMPGFYFGDLDESSEVLRAFDAEFTDGRLNDYKILARLCGEPLCFYLSGDEPIKVPEDFSGLTFRTTGSNQRLVEACGGAGTGMPSNEVFEALRLNVIDGSIAGLGSIITFNYGEVTDCLTIAPFMNTENTIWMSKELYDSMNDVDKAIIDEVAAEFQAKFAEYNEWNHQNVMDYLAANFPEYTVYELNEEEIAQFTELLVPLQDEKAAELDAAGLDGTGALAWLREHTK